MIRNPFRKHSRMVNIETLDLIHGLPTSIHFRKQQRLWPKAVAFGLLLASLGFAFWLIIRS